MYQKLEGNCSWKCLHSVVKQMCDIRVRLGMDESDNHNSEESLSSVTTLKLNLYFSVLFIAVFQI